MSNLKHSEASHTDMFLSYVPSVGLPPDSCQDERIAKIFGLRPNQLKQLADRVRDSCPAAFKTAVRQFEKAGLPRDAPKAARSAHLAITMFARHRNRALLFKHYQEQASSCKSSAAAPPILEFELIKAWNPQYDMTSDSMPGFDFIKADCGCEGSHTTNLEINLQPSFSAALLHKVSSHKIRTKLALVADQLLHELTQETEMSDKDLAAAAGAVYAVASLADNPFVALAFCRLFPALVPHIESAGGPEWAVDETENPIYCPATRKLELGVLSALSRLSEFRKEANAEALAEIKQQLARVEQLYLELGSQEIEKISHLRKDVIEGLEKAQQAYTDAGAPLELQPIHDRITAWENALNHELMQTPSDARSQVTGELMAEVRHFQTKVESFLNNFATISAMREAAMDSDKSWAKQAEALQVVAQKMLKAQSDVHDFASHTKQLPNIELVVPEEAVEPPTEPDHEYPCPDKWTAEMTQLERHWEDQVYEANERINELRQDNASLKTQIDALKLSLAKPEPSCATLPAELVAYAETMATNGTVHDVLRLMQALYSDRLEILPSAFESSKALTSVPVAKLHSVLKAMATTALDQVRVSGQIIDCEPLVPCGVSAQESDTVRNSAKLRKERAFRYKGQRHYFYPHLRVAYGLRVHFDYFPDEQRFVVAYVGGHLSSGKSPTV